MIKTVVVNPLKQERDKISRILSVHADIKVSAHGKDAYDALKLINNLKPDIVILDNNLQYIEGEEIPPLLKFRSPSTAAVILFNHISDFRLFKAASNQVSGLVNKESDLHLLPSIIKSVFEGGCYISPSLASRILHILAGFSQQETYSFFVNKSLSMSSHDDPTKYLSKTELQILTYLGNGISSCEISRNMDLTVGTVRNYISSLMKKTGLNNRSQMARYAFIHGIVPLNPVVDLLTDPIEKKPSR